MNAVQGNFLAEESKEKWQEGEWNNFDMAIMSMALHHVQDPEQMLRRLVERVKLETGVVIVVEFLAEDGSHASHSHHLESLTSGTAGNDSTNPLPGSENTISRHGFSKEEMKVMVQGAGCQEVDIQVFANESKIGDGDGGKNVLIRRGFVCWGRRARRS